MKISKIWAVTILTTAACWILSASAAQAASGYVSGYLWHYQNQGNYCANDGRSCTGAQYVAAEYQQAETVKNVSVYLRDQNGVTIGSGITNTSGYFKFFWWRSSMPTSASIFWTLKHGLGRFQIFTPSGSTWILWTGSQALVDGTTYSAPQYMGSWIWGNEYVPHQLTNVYDGAEKMWRNSLRYANSALNGFANLSIRALSDTVPYSCSSSCALADYNIVQLDLNAAYQPQARVMHEMGHIASYKSNPFTVRAPGNPNLLYADYCYPGTYVSNPAQCNCTCGCYPAGCSAWNLNPPIATPEHRAASFEEGLATFFGDTAIYWSSNPEPYSCKSVSFCPATSDNNIETSTGFACAPGEDRWALSVDRYLRDMYDTSDDPGFGEAMARPYHEFFDVLAHFPSGTSDHQKDEMWNPSYTALDNRDGREASFDFGYHFTALTGLSSVNQYTYNCFP